MEHLLRVRLCLPPRDTSVNGTDPRTGTQLTSMGKPAGSASAANTMPGHEGPVGDEALDVTCLANLFVAGSANPPRGRGPEEGCPSPLGLTAPAGVAVSPWGLRVGGWSWELVQALQLSGLRPEPSWAACCLPQEGSSPFHCGHSTVPVCPPGREPGQSHTHRVLSREAPPSGTRTLGTPKSLISGLCICRERLPSGA